MLELLDVVRVKKEYPEFSLTPKNIGTIVDIHNDSCLSISRISNRFSSKNTFLLYFGANTRWYLQFYFVCAKLLVSMVSFFIDKSSDCVFVS